MLSPGAPCRAESVGNSDYDEDSDEKEAAEGFPLKLSSLISARRAVSQSGQAPNRAPIPPPHLPYQGNLDSWAPALTFCYIYSLREIISLMNSFPGLLELNEGI